MSKVMIDANELLAELQAELESNEAERDKAVKSKWFETAARHEVANVGVRQCIHIVKEKAGLLGY